MSEPNRRAAWILTAAVALGFAGATAWCASALSDAKQSAADAAADTATCRQLASQIAAARRSPADNAKSDDDIGQRLEQAMTASDVNAESLARVAPQPPHTVNGVPRRSTQIVLERVTLKQTLSFVAALAGDPAHGVTLDNLELTIPTTDGEAGDEWNVELNVSQGATGHS